MLQEDAWPFSTLFELKQTRQPCKMHVCACLCVCTQGRRRLGLHHP